MDDARSGGAEGDRVVRLNLTNIRRGAGLPGATRPIEVLQPIQALAQARTDYLAAVLAYDRRSSGSIMRSGGRRNVLLMRANPSRSTGGPS